jgi:hypothetical protein
VPDDPAPRPTPPTRTPDVVAAELATTRRYLVDAPPHHGAGTREVLDQRLRRLERELRGLQGSPRS